jgi:hypothetical protein
MEELTLEKSIEHLSHLESYQMVMDEILGMYESHIDELDKVEADKLAQHAGTITAYRDILREFYPRNHGV